MTLFLRAFLAILVLWGHATQSSKLPPKPPRAINLNITLPRADVPTVYNISFSVGPEARPASAPISITVGAASTKDHSDAEQREQSGILFDKSKKSRNLPAVATPANSGAETARRLPPGVKSLSIHTVRKPEDVDRALTHTASAGYADRLKRLLPRMSPFQMYSYTDASGTRFAAIDLLSKPEIVGLLPMIYEHEVKLIKKIMKSRPNIQVLLPEGSERTPDLIVDGTVLEMKSLLDAKDPDIRAYLRDANRQILAHARRHGMGSGDVAIDCSANSIPVSLAAAARQIAQWGKKPAAPNKKIAIKRIYLFLKSGVKIFVRRQDGSFQLEDPGSPLAWNLGTVLHFS